MRDPIAHANTPTQSRAGRFQGLNMNTKQAKIADANEGADMLERVLDAIHGKNRGAQIPGHYGNGAAKETKHAA